jgi:hypothetical protein
MTEALKQVGNHIEAPPRSPSLFNIGEVSSHLGIPVWQRAPVQCYWRVPWPPLVQEPMQTTLARSLALIKFYVSKWAHAGRQLLITIECLDLGGSGGESTSRQLIDCYISAGKGQPRASRQQGVDESTDCRLVYIRR